MTDQIQQKQEQRQQYLQHIVENIPHQPGVYKMKNADNEIIYIGKAKNLRKRVGSYFMSDKDKMMRTIKMVEQIADIAYTEVDTELEALMLETNLIKEYRPKYNVLMKDDKNYIYIKITVNEEYPRIMLVRKVAKDKARYFGPKTAVHKVIKTLKALQKIFPFNHCPLAIDFSTHTNSGNDLKLTEQKKFDHLNRCIGPCIFSVDQDKYRHMINQIIEFLEGKHESIIDQIREDMIKAAAEKKFEVAGAIRDKLKIIEEMVEHQKISDPDQKDLDIINFCELDEKIYFNLFQLRNGKLIDQENFIFSNSETKEEGTVLQAFLEQYYEKAADIPKEILIPETIENTEILEEWLSTMKNQKVKILVPERGKKNKLLELSFANAQSFAKQSQIKWQGAAKSDRTKALENLKDLLQLPTPPKRLECYDISHFGGTETVSSMTVFENGFPKKDDYRKFKLHQQTNGAPNDFESMEETLTRRLKYLKPSKALAEIKLRKAKKKDLITLKIEKPVGIIYLIENNKLPTGHFEITVTPSGKPCITKLQLEPQNQLDTQTLIHKIFEKVKGKRLYFNCPNEQIDTFAEIGFEHIIKIPEDFTPTQDHEFLVFDRTKHAVDKSFLKTPDLIIIDGGKGQLSSAQKALKKYGLAVPMISIAKREEELFRPDNPIPILLRKDDPILLLIQHIRDEAHRFAVSYHKNLRLKATTSSILDTIPGIGPELKMQLLQKFGSIEGIKNASAESITTLVGEHRAKKIIAALR